MDESPIPRCNLRRSAIFVCFILAVIIAMQINISTYGNIDDKNCLSFTTVSECENIGIIYKLRIIDIPICCCAFFALKQRKKVDTKIISPPSCHQYSKILNC